MEEAIGDRAIVPAAICLGIAGVDRPDDYAVVGAIMRRIGYKARVHGRQRRAGRAGGRGSGPARRRRHLGHRVDFLRPERKG